MTSCNLLFVIIGFLACSIHSARSSRPYGESRPKDPSTVINVYPSLVNLGKGGGRGSGSISTGAYPCTTDACAAASNLKPKYLENGDKMSLKNGKPDSLPSEKEREEAPSDDLKHKKPKTFREEMGMNFGDTHKTNVMHNQKHEDKFRKFQDEPNMEKKVYNWASFRDMLQMLKKRKHLSSMNL